MLHKMGEYLLLVLTAGLLFGAWRYGDWENWRTYYPTADLFMKFFDRLYETSYTSMNCDPS